MTDIRCVPTNILTWPAVADMLPDQKHLFVYLWYSRFATSTGCYQLPRGMAAVELSFSEAALNDALLDFERRNLIAIDDETSELFVLSWFRFNTFKSGPRRRILAAEFKKIQSSKLRQIVEKSMGCIPREEKISKVNNASPPNKILISKTAPEVGNATSIKNGVEFLAGLDSPRVMSRVLLHLRDKS